MGYKYYTKFGKHVSRGVGGNRKSQDSMILLHTKKLFVRMQNHLMPCERMRGSINRKPERMLGVRLCRRRRMISRWLRIRCSVEG